MGTNPAEGTDSVADEWVTQVFKKCSQMNKTEALAKLNRQVNEQDWCPVETFEAGIDDVLSYLHYPQSHRVRISSTNLGIRRRTRVIGIFPHAAACLRLIGMLLVKRTKTIVAIAFAGCRRE